MVALRPTKNSSRHAQINKKYVFHKRVMSLAINANVYSVSAKTKKKMR